LRKIKQIQGFAATKAVFLAQKKYFLSKKPKFIKSVDNTFQKWYNFICSLVDEFGYCDGKIHLFAPHKPLDFNLMFQHV